MLSSDEDESGQIKPNHIPIDPKDKKTTDFNGAAILIKGAKIFEPKTTPLEELIRVKPSTPVVIVIKKKAPKTDQPPIDKKNKNSKESDVKGKEENKKELFD